MAKVADPAAAPVEQDGKGQCSTNPPKPLGVIDYVTPNATPERILPSFPLAVCLAMPGAVCWACYFLLSAGPNRTAENLLEAIALTAIYPAIACAAASLLLFVRFRRAAYPWYVAANLLVNVSGLAFWFSGLLYEMYQYAAGVYQFCVQYWL